MVLTTSHSIFLIVSVMIVGISLNTQSQSALSVIVITLLNIQGLLATSDLLSPLVRIDRLKHLKGTIVMEGVRYEVCRC